MIKSKIAVTTTLLLATNIPVLRADKKDANNTTTDRPNIILILTDDQEASSITHMPNLNELLIDEGTTFTNFIINVPHCCPSRASILRGQYTHNHQVITNRPPYGSFSKFRDLGHQESTIATWLQNSGYSTVFFGKYLNGYANGSRTHKPPGWDEWYAVVDGQNFNYRLNENRQIVQYGSKPEDYETDVLADKAADFIRRSAGEAPFFIFLATDAPHTPFVCAPRHSNKFANKQAPRPPSFNEADVSDKPEWINSSRLMNQEEIDDIDDRYRIRLRMMLAVDDMIKTIIDALEASNELDNTYLFFTSDNGFHQGEHRRERGKGTPYEEVIRMPLIVRGPGVPQAKELKHLTSNIDLAPTFAALGATAAPSFVDGVSIVPLLTSQSLPINNWRNAVFVQHWQFEGSGNSIPDYKGVRTNDYMYLEYGTDEMELYDLRVDPYQLENLAQTVDPNLINSLATKLQNQSNCAGANCFDRGAVPVELVSFSAAALGNTVHLKWKTETETNNLGFNIERSENGVDFIKIGFVQGNGSTAIPQRYSFEDSDLPARMFYYRLQQIDSDGQFEYSQAIEVNVAAPGEFALAQNYPNPFNPETFIRYQLAEPTHVRLTIYNTLGELVKQLVNEEAEAGNYAIRWNGNNDAGNLVVSGIYFYSLEIDGQTLFSKQLVFMK